MSELARWLRHDLKSPVAIVAGYAELLEDDALDPTARREATRRISQAAKVLGELIDDAGAWVLLEVGELERELDLRPLEFDDLADDFIDDVEQSHPRTVVSLEGSFAATGDAAYLRQALRLVIAAVDVAAPRELAPEIRVVAEGCAIELDLGAVRLGEAELRALSEGGAWARAEQVERPARMLALAGELVRGQRGTVAAAPGSVRIELPPI